MPRLSGKVAFITGATSGIGAAAAELFAAEGASVAIAGRNPARGEAVAARIVEKGGVAKFIATDVTEPESFSGALNQAAEHFGGLDVLYNNAGGSTSADGPVTVAPLEEFWRCIKLDLFGTWLGCRFAHSADAEARWRLDHQLGLDHGRHGHPQPRRLHRGQGRRHRADPLDGGGVRQGQYPGQHHHPGRRGHRARARLLREGAAPRSRSGMPTCSASPNRSTSPTRPSTSHPTSSRRTTGQILPVDSGILIS